MKCEIKLGRFFLRVFFPSSFFCPFLCVVMVRVSALNDALNTLTNAERRGKRQALIRPCSKVTVKFLSVMQKHGMYSLVCFIYVKVTLVSSKLLTTTALARSLLTCLAVWIKLDASALALMFPLMVLRDGPPTSCLLVSSVTLCWPLLKVSWITKRPEGRVPEERFVISVYCSYSVDPWIFLLKTYTLHSSRPLTQINYC